MAKIQLRASKQNIVVTGREGYVTRVQNYSRVKTEEFATHVAQDVHMPYGTVMASIGAIVRQIEEMLLNGHAISVAGVGNFRMSWNNKSTASLEAIKANSPYQRRILYSPAKGLKIRMYDAPMQLTID